jgi:hypothetical protein
MKLHKLKSEHMNARCTVLLFLLFASIKAFCQGSADTAAFDVASYEYQLNNINQAYVAVYYNDSTGEYKYSKIEITKTAQGLLAKSIDYNPAFMEAAGETHLITDDELKYIDLLIPDGKPQAKTGKMLPGQILKSHINRYQHSGEPLGFYLKTSGKIMGYPVMMDMRGTYSRCAVPDAAKEFYKGNDCIKLVMSIDMYISGANPDGKPNKTVIEVYYAKNVGEICEQTIEKGETKDPYRLIKFINLKEFAALRKKK